MADRRGTRRDLKESLETLAGPSASTLEVVSNVFMAPFGQSGHVQRKSNTSRLFGELAPKLMTPRMAQSVASSSRAHPSKSMLAPTGLRSMDFAPLGRLSLTSRRLTSRELSVAEAANELLSSDIPESSPEGVSLLRGFKATIPSAEQSKVRRRKTRNVDLPEMGLREMGSRARGLLIEEGSESGRRTKRKGKGVGRQSMAASVVLGEEELSRQRREILVDKENVHVRRSLLNSEIDEVSSKIVALEAIRNQLQQSLLRLHEEELELDEELESVMERLAFEGRKVTSTPSKPSSGVKRRKGPAFLPSEHDDLPAGVAFMTLTGHSAPITGLDFSEPYGALVSASADESVRVWDLSSGEEVGRLRGHAGAVKCLQVNDNTCITGGQDGTIRLWDLTQLDLDPDQSESESGLNGEGWSDLGDGSQSHIRSETEGESDTGGGPCVRVLEGHTKGVSAVYFEDTCLVSGASDKTIRQWDVSTGQCVLTMDILWAINSHSSLSTSSLLTPSVASASGASPFFLPSSSLLTGDFSYPPPPFSDGSWDPYTSFVGSVQFWGYALVSGSADGAVRMWDMRTGTAHRTLVGHTAPVTTLGFDEFVVVSGGLDRCVRIWDLRTGNTTDTIKYEFPVTDLQFDTRKVAVCAGENAIKIYNRTTLQQSPLVINGHTSPVEKLRYADRYMVSGGRDAVVKVWSI